MYLAPAFCGEGSASLCSISDVCKLFGRDKPALEVLAVSVNAVYISIGSCEDYWTPLGQAGMESRRSFQCAVHFCGVNLPGKGRKFPRQKARAFAWNFNKLWLRLAIQTTDGQFRIPSTGR